MAEIYATEDSTIVLETERLIARRWNPETDAEDAFEMYGDPEVMRFLGRTPQVLESVEVTRERLQKILDVDRERNNGTGSFPLIDKERNVLVGALLVKRLPDADNVPTDDMEVGWHLKKSEWGKGYATEAGRAGIEYAFNVLGVPKLYAVVYKENSRSIAVTRRLGMKPLGPTERYYGVTIELFEAPRP